MKHFLAKIVLFFATILAISNAAKLDTTTDQDQDHHDYPEENFNHVTEPSILFQSGTELESELEIKSKLEEFRIKMAPNIKPKNEYMLKDDYLLRFLREKNYNISASTELMVKMIQWRSTNNIDALLDEEFPEFEQDFKIYLEGCDRMNRPVIYVPFGTWEIRSATLSGLAPQLERYINKVFEDATSLLRTVNSIGVSSIHEATLLLNFDGVDMKSHACPKCLPIYLYFFSTLAQNYPGLVTQIYFVNTPQIITLVWDVYKDVFNQRIKDISVIFMRRDGSAKMKERLRREIHPESLLAQFGGDREEGGLLTFDKIRLGQDLMASLSRLGAVKVRNECAADFKLFERLILEIDTVVERKEKSRVNRELRSKCY